MSDNGTPLKGKTAVILGVASDTSIAWAIAQELAKRGANILLGYQFRYHSRIKDLAPTLPNLIGFHRCDIMKDEELDKFFGEVKTPIDIVVHAIAFAPQTAFAGRLVETSQDDFSLALSVSAHSLAKFMNKAKDHMPNGGSVMALTYLGGVRVSQNYKLMGVAKAALEAYVRELAADLGPDGIRVNAISPGPINTLAASGIPDFELMLDYNKAVAPMRKNVTQHDVATTAAFLSSDDSKMITGQTIYVDGGYSIIGVPSLG
ncbi:MAG: enoyl-[acyl-carrier-protein] reductase FabI [Elusimicrobia bacterium]|nr:MAG: enoyl-[acyl-carrier-protein] reductase FabI [Elusimicrobiota bacterium]